MRLKLRITAFIDLQRQRWKPLQKTDEGILTPYLNSRVLITTRLQVFVDMREDVPVLLINEIYPCAD